MTAKTKDEVLITTYDLKAAFSELDKFDCLEKPHNFIEVNLWRNGDGFDVHLSSEETQRFSLSWGQYKALKKLINKLDQ